MNEQKYHLRILLTGLVRQYDNEQNVHCLIQMVDALSLFDRRYKSLYRQLQKLLLGTKCDHENARTALTAIWVLSVGGEFTPDLRALIGQAADRIQDKIFPLLEESTT